MRQTILINSRFNNLVVKKYLGKISTTHLVLCRCDCGNFKELRFAHVKSGHTKSCGCFMRKVSKEKNTKHGDSKTPLYKRWLAMRSRCRKTSQDRKHYYERGIKVCKRWNSYESFKKDMGKSFKEEKTLERKDTNKGYSPKNCCWATQYEQVNNTTITRRFEYDSKILTLRDISNLTKINAQTLYSRVHTLRKSIDEAVAMGPGRKPYNKSLS